MLYWTDVMQVHSVLGVSQGWVVTVLNVASLCCPWAEAGWGSFLSTVQATARIENDD